MSVSIRRHHSEQWDKREATVLMLGGSFWPVSSGRKWLLYASRDKPVGSNVACRHYEVNDRSVGKRPHEAKRLVIQAAGQLYAVPHQQDIPLAAIRYLLNAVGLQSLTSTTSNAR